MRVSAKQATAAAIVVIAGVALWKFTVGGGDAAKRASPAIPVTAIQVAARDFPLYLSGIGTVQAFNSVTVRARIDGELTAVTFHEGEDVKKGDLLARIDARAYQAALHNAEATLAKDQAALENAKLDLVRYRDTAAKGYTSQQRLDTQVSTVNTLSAAVQGDQASVENARVQLSYTAITAPIDGRTGIRVLDQGNLVRANDASGLVVITQVQPISAIFPLPQDALPTVLAAQDKGEVAVTAFSRDGETEFDQGKLALIDNQIDPATGTVRLKATFPNAHRRLWPGEFINVRLLTGVARGGVAVPAQVVQRGTDGPYAYVIKGDSTVEVRPLTVGQQEAGEILVTKGLKAGERVVLDGQLRLQPGAKVRADMVTSSQVGEAGVDADAPRLNRHDDHGEGAHP